VNPKFSVGLLNRYMSAKGLNQNSFSLTGHYIVNKKLSISSGYSIIGKSFTNMPLAILYKRESSQSFIGTDNFLSFLAPSTTEFSGITFGTCFYLFRKKNLYRSPTEDFPYYKPKKNKKVQALWLMKKYGLNSDYQANLPCLQGLHKFLSQARYVFLKAEVKPFD